MEIHYISLYDTLSPNGYNLELGGNGKGKQTLETCLKISKSKKGVKTGPRVMSLDEHNKMSEIAKNRTYSSETRAKMSASAKKCDRSSKKTTNKKVIDLSTGFIWDSAREAADTYGIKVGCLYDYLAGKCKNKTNLRYLNEVLDV
jgi:hypothetical protein